MDFTYPRETEPFREQVADWLSEHLVGDFARLGAGAELRAVDWHIRLAWEQELGRGGWIGLSWPESYGGRAVTIMEEMVFAEEYAKAAGPTRTNTLGEGLLGPTLIEWGTDEQKRRFLSPILRGEQTWCQGFSEPSAGSDLAGLSTRARLDGPQWVIDGQKVWTSQAHLADWIFVLARTDPHVAKHKGISFFLVPLDQSGVEVRPLRDIAGERHFCEVFFDHAVTEKELIVGSPGDGWSIAMSTLGFERGTAFIGTLVRYGRELQQLIELARQAGRLSSPTLRQSLADLRIGYDLMRYGLYRTVTQLQRSGRPGPEASIAKLQWSQWHQKLGEVALEILGAAGVTETGDPVVHAVQHAFLFSRAHTIYAGSSQIQRNVIAERLLGLPKEPAA